MKYIRTKDGRIIDTTKKSVALGYHPKEADTIEELCDEFVYELGLKHEIYDILCKHKENDINFIKNGWHIYGAIWTKCGLKYVAEVNEKGELKLL